MITYPSSTTCENGSLRPAPNHAGSIREQAEGRLRRDGYLSMQPIRCEFHAGVLRLSGHVPTYYLKQLAQEIVLGVSGVVTVENEVEVLPARRLRK